MNCLSVMRFAGEVLQIEYIIVCGHYGCGGVKAALENTRLELIDNRLRHIRDVGRDYRNELAEARDDNDKLDKLCGINVIEQVMNVGQTTTLQDAWLRGRTIKVVGWIYHISDGIFKDLQITIDSLESLNKLRLNMLSRRKGKEI